MKLSGFKVDELQFDIAGRTLDVLHEEDPGLLFKKLNELDLGTRLEATEESADIPQIQDHSKERKLLWSVLLINFSFFLIEMATGLISRSMGLIADSLDMMADAIVYGLSLYAVGHAVSKKQMVAKISGCFQMTLAVFGFIEVVRRFITHEETPGFQTMIVVSVFALIGNALCLYLLQKSKSQEAHMQASMIFTSNDVIVNIGVMVAGGLVYLTQSKYPDLIVGAIVFLLVLRGSIRILRLS